MIWRGETLRVARSPVKTSPVQRTERVSSSQLTGDCDWHQCIRLNKTKPWGLLSQDSRSSAWPSTHTPKGLLSILCDHGGFIYCELLRTNANMTAKLHWAQCMWLSRARRQKRPQYEQREYKVIVQHDNAWPHIAKPVRTYLKTLKWEDIPHSSCRLDFALSDYYLFRSIEHGWLVSSSTERKNFEMIWVVNSH